MITGCLQQKSGFYYAVLYLNILSRFLVEVKYEFVIAIFYFSFLKTFWY